MNILIINHYAGAPRLGRELRPYFLAKYWQAAGHKVTVAAADHSHLRQNDPVQGKGPELRRIGEVDYLFFPTPRYNDSVAGRGKNIAAFVRGLWQSAAQLAEELDPDVVVAQSGYPYDFFPAKRLASLCGAKTVYEVRDLWPIQMQEHYRYPPRHPAVRFAEYALTKAVAEADHVVTVLPHGSKYLSRFGLDTSRASVVLSGVAAGAKQIAAPAGCAEKIAAFRQGGSLLVMYCGNIGINHDITAFVESAALLSSDIRLVLVGNGGNKIPLKRRTKELGLQNLLFLDGVLPSQVPAMLEMADILFFPMRPSRQLQYGIASAKLLGYMLAAKPVICDADPACNPVSEADCGLVLNGSSDQEIAGGIRLLAAMDEEQRLEMGRRGREYVLNGREYSQLAAQYLNLLEELTGKDGKKTGR